MKKKRLKRIITERILKFWYSNSQFAYFLWPFSFLFQCICLLRYKYYCLKGRSSFHLPVIVVGNISLGGTGKTPLVGWLADCLAQNGFHPGIVMHGYGGKKNQIVSVTPTSQVGVVGDEALMFARKFQYPVVAGRKRVQAIHYLHHQYPQVNIILCDDGLQHYALSPEIEIAVIDAARSFGNGLCLPAGPLRESPRRLKKVHFVVVNGKADQGEWEMSLFLSETVYQIRHPQEKKRLEAFKGLTVHAIAGIGNPDRFFGMLKAKGINIIEHRFEDHYDYQENDIRFSDNLPILMTEKDAVKCLQIAPLNAWYVPLEVSLPLEFSESVIRRISYGQKTTRDPRLPHLQATPRL